MTTGEKVSVASSVAVLVLLLVGGWLASRWRAETRADLRQIAEAQRRGAAPDSLRWFAVDDVGKTVDVTVFADPGESPDDLYRKLKERWKTASRKD